MSATGARSPATDGPDEALVERFKSALERLWPEGGTLGLAVSGGPDSLAMLLLAEAAMPGRYEVATVDHGLRPESADECAIVARTCADRGVPCEVLPVQVAAGNVQAEARAARYAALAEWAMRRGLSAIATAHHADDQAETLLMRLNRGSGVSGLAGVRERTAIPPLPVPVIRPLLAFRRADLAAVLAASGLVAVQDPSNANDRFDRARLRKALAESPWLDPLALAASAAHLAAADDALDWAAAREWNERVVGAEDGFRYRPLAPKAVAMRVIARIVADFGGRARGQDLARLLDRLEAGESGNVAGVLATAEGGDWLFRREPPRRA
jgi:tRNA(Ile)-lysidine synthase